MLQISDHEYIHEDFIKKVFFLDDEPYITIIDKNNDKSFVEDDEYKENIRQFCTEKIKPFCEDIEYEKIKSLCLNEKGQSMYYEIESK